MCKAWHNLWPLALPCQLREVGDETMLYGALKAFGSQSEVAAACCDALAAVANSQLDETLLMVRQTLPPDLFESLALSLPAIIGVMRANTGVVRQVALEPSGLATPCLSCLLDAHSEINRSTHPRRPRCRSRAAARLAASASAQNPA